MKWLRKMWRLSWARSLLLYVKARMKRMFHRYIVVGEKESEVVWV